MTVKHVSINLAVTTIDNLNARIDEEKFQAKYGTTLEDATALQIFDAIQDTDVATDKNWCEGDVQEENPLPDTIFIETEES